MAQWGFQTPHHKVIGRHKWEKLSKYFDKYETSAISAMISSFTRNPEPESKRLSKKLTAWVLLLSQVPILILMFPVIFIPCSDCFPQYGITLAVCFIFNPKPKTGLVYVCLVQNVWTKDPCLIHTRQMRIRPWWYSVTNYIMRPSYSWWISIKHILGWTVEIPSKHPLGFTAVSTSTFLCCLFFSASPQAATFCVATWYFGRLLAQICTLQPFLQRDIATHRFSLTVSQQDGLTWQQPLLHTPVQTEKVGVGCRLDGTWLFLYTGHSEALSCLNFKTTNAILAMLALLIRSGNKRGRSNLNLVGHTVLETGIQMDKFDRSQSHLSR